MAPAHPHLRLLLILLATVPLWSACKQRVTEDTASAQAAAIPRPADPERPSGKKSGPVTLLFERIDDGGSLVASFLCELSAEVGTKELSGIRVKTPAGKVVTLKREEARVFSRMGPLTEMDALFPGGEYTILLESGEGDDASTRAEKATLDGEANPYPVILTPTPGQKGLSTTLTITLAKGEELKAHLVQIEQEGAASDVALNKGAHALTIGPKFYTLKLSAKQRLKPSTTYHMEVEAHHSGNRVSRKALHFTTGPR